MLPMRHLHYLLAVIAAVAIGRLMERGTLAALKEIEDEYTPPPSHQIAYLQTVIDSSPNLRPHLQQSYKSPTEVCGQPPSSKFINILRHVRYNKCLRMFKEMDLERKETDVLSRIKDINVCHMLGLDLIG